MRTYLYGKDIIPSGERVVALGFFDGMHIAHRELILSAVKLARERGESAAVFTFRAEGSRIKSGVGRLYTTEEKLSVLEALGIDEAVVAEFDSLSELTPESFVSDVLIGALNCSVAASGYNFRFGKGREGDSDTLLRLMKRHGREAFILEEQKVGARTVSSTAVREALLLADTDTVTRLLGVPYSISGVVERGIGLGHTLGFPTVNIPLNNAPEIKSGVYRTAVLIGDRLYTGVTNIGSCPTVERERHTHSETFILDFSGELYGKKIKI